MKSALLTNGYRFHDQNFVKKVQLSPLSRILFSIKAGNNKNYKELTGVDVFNKIDKAINNLKSFSEERLKYDNTPCTHAYVNCIIIIKDNIKESKEIDYSKMYHNLQEKYLELSEKYYNLKDSLD